MKTIVILIILIISVYTDIKSRIIPNKVVAVGMLFGIIYNTFYGLPNLYSSLLGGIVALAILIIPFAIGGLGGGDVKLTIAIGMIMGPRFVISTIVYMAISGAIIAIIWMVHKKRFCIGLSKIKQYLIATVLIRKLPPITDQTDMAFPYSIAIAIGVIVSFYNM